MKRNMCKDCEYSEAFQDQFTGKTRHRCKIGQYEDIGFGDTALIIDGGCSKYKEKWSDDEYRMLKQESYVLCVNCKNFEESDNYCKLLQINFLPDGFGCNKGI